MTRELGPRDDGIPNLALALFALPVQNFHYVAVFVSAWRAGFGV
jgi:hypothetical protein